MAQVTQEPVKVGISACLTGARVRYDGDHKLDPFLMETFGPLVRYVPVCPEEGCGLGVPREPMGLEGEAEEPRLITTATRRDVTGLMTSWSKKRLLDLEEERLWGFIFKSRSPSCAIEGVQVFRGEGLRKRRGTGIFARMFSERFPWVPTEDEERLHAPEVREHFVHRIFAMKRWRDVLAGKHEKRGLVDFHGRHKLFILARSPVHYREMGRLAARAGELAVEELYERYGALFKEALGLRATRRKQTNVLHHVLGYFKRRLSPDHRRELLRIIDAYGEGSLPVIVPVTCLNHYTGLYGQPYLEQQVYLHPHPVEVRLLNHA